MLVRGLRDGLALEILLLLIFACVQLPSFVEEGGLGDWGCGLIGQRAGGKEG